MLAEFFVVFFELELLTLWEISLLDWVDIP